MTTAPGSPRHHASALDAFAAFAANLAHGELPPNLADVAKDCIIGSLSGSFTIAASAEGGYALSIARQSGSAPLAAVFGTSLRCAAADAAFVNGTSASAVGRGDTHPAGASHPGTVVVPAALALAEARGASGRTVLEAIIAGYEAMCRLGNALVTPSFAAIYRPTGMTGPMPAGLAAAHVIGLDHAGLVNAASLGAHMAAGLNEWAHTGTFEYTFHSGHAARGGVTAALLAEAGAISAGTILDGKAGLLAAYGATPRVSELTAELGSVHRMLEIVHKPAPACFFVQTPCQVAQRVIREHDIDLASIRAIEIRVCRAAAEYPGCDSIGPVLSRQSAKLSLQFSVASVLVKRGIFDTNWSDFANATVNALAARAHVVVDDALTAAFPRQAGAAVAIVLADGMRIEASQADFVSMQRGEIVAKFMESAAPVLGPAAAGQAVEMILGLEATHDFREVTRVLAPPPQR